MSKLVKVRIDADAAFQALHAREGEFIVVDAEIVEEKQSPPAPQPVCDCNMPGDKSHWNVEKYGHVPGCPADAPQNCTPEFCHRPAKEECVCKEPWTKGVIHRTDGPCHLEPRPSSKESKYDFGPFIKAVTDGVDLPTVEELVIDPRFDEADAFRVIAQKVNQLCQAHNLMVQFIRDGK